MSLPRKVVFNVPALLPDLPAPSAGDGVGGARRRGAPVRGACSADFKRSIEPMYLSVTHGAELALPAAGAETRRERLENYAWTVEVGGR